ncbi:unnamed protein product [Ectocarpus sp. 4 AP-2014]
MMLTQAVVLMLGCSISHAFVQPLAGSRNAGKNKQPSSFLASSIGGNLAPRRAPVPLRQQQEAAVVAAETAPEGSLVLIEVTKKHAKVFKSVAKGSVPEVVEPVDEWRVHETSNREKRSQGQGKHHAEKARRGGGGRPDRGADPVAEEAYLVKFYMEELSGVIEKADSVLLVGHGNAKSNIAEVLASALCERQPGLTDKIEDVLRVDGKHITQNQLLKLGRRHLTHAEDPRRPT